MKYALVSGGNLIKTESSQSFTWNGLTYSQVDLLSKEVRKAAGIYDYVSATYTPAPTGYKTGGITHVVDDAAGTVTEVISNIALTTEELATQLVQAKTNQIKTISEACKASIYSGFKSNALGLPHQYPFSDMDQANLTGNVLLSTLPIANTAGWLVKFICADDNGVWGYRDHTQAEMQQVGMDAAKVKLAKVLQNAALAEEINALATTIDEVQAIVWTDPTIS
jgi:hypothetical protein